MMQLLGERHAKRYILEKTNLNSGVMHYIPKHLLFHSFLECFTRIIFSKLPIRFPAIIIFKCLLHDHLNRVLTIIITAHIYENRRIT